MRDVLFFLIHNTLIAATLLFVLGLWAWFDRKADAKNESLSALLVAAAIWLYGYALWVQGGTVSQSMFWLRTLFFVGSMLPTFYFFLVYAFFAGKPVRPRMQAIGLLPNLALFLIAYFTPTLVTAGAGGTTYSFGAARLLFAAQFAVTLAAAFIALLQGARRRKRAGGQLLLLLAGGILAFESVFPLMFGANISAPGTPFWLGYLGSIGVAAGGLLIAYAADKGKFTSDIRPVGLDLFVLLAFLVVIIDVVVSQDLLDFSLRLVVFVILVIAGVSATRVVAREMRRLREIEALHDQVVMMNGRLIEADKLKTRFVSFVSHQLRAPLSGIRIYLTMLAEGNFEPLNPRQQEIVMKNLDAIEGLKETVETFLDVAKIEMGKTEIYRSDTNLAALMTRVVNELSPLAEEKGLKIAVDAPMSLPNVSCDSGKLFHAAANLVHNAIKYTDAGKISVSASVEGNAMTVRVVDTGIGLTKDARRHIEEVLAGGIEAVKFDETGGSGLGLYIVKNIVEAHGGKVFVDSPGKGKGSTFGFRIPLR